MKKHSGKKLQYFDNDLPKKLRYRMFVETSIGLGPHVFSRFFQNSLQEEELENWLPQETVLKHYHRY